MLKARVPRSMRLPKDRGGTLHCPKRFHPKATCRTVLKGLWKPEKFVIEGPSTNPQKQLKVWLLGPGALESPIVVIIDIGVYFGAPDFWKLPMRGLRVPKPCHARSLRPETLLKKAFEARGCLLCIESTPRQVSDQTQRRIMRAPTASTHQRQQSKA